MSEVETRFLISPSSDFDEIGEASDAYIRYWTSKWESAPKYLKQFVIEDWYHVFSDPRCPHDSVLDQIFWKGKTVKISYKNRKFDTNISFVYYKVRSISLNCDALQESPVFYYDEFLLQNDRFVSHNIKGLGDWSCFVICEDVEFMAKRNSNISAGGSAGVRQE